MIVDNAIVVIENIVRQRQQGRDPAAAAAVGTREVAGAVVASTLTTCVIFLPVVFMRTTSGQLFQTLALVVVFTLGCSLLVALTLVPVLASRLLEGAAGVGHGARLARRARLRVAGRALRAGAWRRPGASWPGGRRHAGARAGCGAFWTRIPVELAPELDTDAIDVELEMGRGTSIAVARTYLDELERAGAAPSCRRGRSPRWRRRCGATTPRSRSGSSTRRGATIDPSVLADRLREATAGRIPGAEVRVEAQSGLGILRRIFSASGGRRGGRGPAARLRPRAGGQRWRARCGTRMEQVPGVVEVDVSRQDGASGAEPPLRSCAHRRRRPVGAGRGRLPCRPSVAGRRAGSLPRGRRAVPDHRAAASGRPAGRRRSARPSDPHARRAGPAAVRAGPSPKRRAVRPTIDRIDGQRVTYITANLESGVALGEAVSGIRARTADLPLPAGFSLTFGGAWREQQRAHADFVIAIALALALVYMVMAGQFERYLDPLIVMTSVPVALVGVVPALLLTGTTLNVQSVMGLVMLVGIVVNNAIVLVDYMSDIASCCSPRSNGTR